MKSTWIRPEDVDLVTGSRDAHEEEELPPKHFGEKIWRVSLIFLVYSRRLYLES